jgi:hypothetical protein
MKINISEEGLSLALDALEKQHRELVRKGESWSFDLEGDFENYTKARTDELQLAVIIHNLKKQKTFAKENPGQVAEEPLADWEIELLTGGKTDG